MRAIEPADNRATSASGVRPEDLGIGALFDRMHEAAIVMDMFNGEIKLWNAAAEEIFGYTADEACGMSAYELMTPERRRYHRNMALAERPSDTQAAVDTGEVVEIPATCKAGNPLKVEATFSTLASVGNPETVYCIAIVRDVTRKKRLEALAVGLIEAMERMPAGGLPVPPRIGVAPEGIPHSHEPPLEPLTKRELEVMGHVIEGKTNAGIGEAMFISESTVKSYMGRIIAKMKVDNRAQAAAKAVKLGLLAS